MKQTLIRWAVPNLLALLALSSCSATHFQGVPDDHPLAHTSLHIVGTASVTPADYESTYHSLFSSDTVFIDSLASQFSQIMHQVLPQATVTFLHETNVVPAKWDPRNAPMPSQFAHSRFQDEATEKITIYSDSEMNTDQTKASADSSMTLIKGFLRKLPEQLLIHITDVYIGEASYNELNSFTGAGPGSARQSQQQTACMMSVSFEVWDVKNQKLFLVFQSKGTESQFLFFSSAAFKGAMHNSVASAAFFLLTGKQKF